MKSAPVSSVTGWVAERVGSPIWRDRLGQELQSAAAAGHSSAAIERRAVAAIVKQIVAQIRQQKMYAAIGIVTGWVALAFAGGIVTSVATRFGGPGVHASQWQWQHYLAIVAIGLLYSAFSGWVVGALHQRHRTAAVFGYLASVLVLTVVSLPLYYLLAPELFTSTILPHIGLFVGATLIVAPLSITVAGLRRQNGASIVTPL
jgi:hypothetical protein